MSQLLEVIMSKTDTFVEKTCIPCEGGVPRFDIDQAQAVIKNIPNWELNEDATNIFRNFSFDNFREAQNFAVKVGELAEQEFHHPDISYGWGYCKILFQTHKIRGLHENDIIMAAKVDAILSNETD